MKALKDIFLLLILSVVLIECTSTQKKELEVEKQQLQVSAEEDISSRIDRIIKESDWPTDEQKEKLIELKANTRMKISNINLALKKTKILLVQNLLLKNSAVQKQRLLKKEITKLYKTKVDVMLEALERANEILGKGDKLSKLNGMYHLYLLNEY